MAAVQSAGPVRSTAPKLLRMSEVATMTTYSKVYLYRLIKKGEFPRPIHLGKNRIAFDEAVVVKWLDEKRGASAQ